MLNALRHHCELHLGDLDGVRPRADVLNALLEWKPSPRALATPDPQTGEPRLLRAKHTLRFIPLLASQSALDAWRRYPGKVYGRPPSERLRTPASVVDALPRVAANENS